MRILTPTENHRFNELIGFVGITIAVLLALSLLSYSPQDASLNVAAPAGVSPARNWIGPVGAHTADLLFQVFGYASFLLPIGLMVLAWRWFRSQTVQAPTAKITGYVLLSLAVPAELTLMNMPEVRSALPAGGLLGTLLAEGLRAGFNSIGAHVVGLACLVAGLILSTRFSFALTAKWLRARSCLRPRSAMWPNRCIRGR